MTVSSGQAATRRIRRVLSTRAGGESAGPYAAFNLGDRVGEDVDVVERNRARLAEAIGLQPQRLVWMEQVHGRDVQVVTAPPSGAVPMSDGIVTNQPGLALNVLTADCIPMLAWDETAGVIAAVHAGRPGVRLDIGARAIERMRELGAEPSRIEVLLGPAICGRCYEVPAAMQADVEQHAPGAATRTRSGTPGLDLHAGLVGQLQRAGVEQITVDSRCTAESSDLYSYRRDGTTGRMTAVIWIEDSDQGET
nr:peptidoglycan editing factor PgeF [Epidermidibacterium keratini]